MRKALIAAACAVPLFFWGAAPSLADVDVDIGIGGGPGIYVDPYGDDDDYRYRRRGRLSCGEARGLIRDRGYRRIETIRCRGRIYTFEASRRGNRYILKVNAFTGAVWRQ